MAETGSILASLKGAASNREEVRRSAEYPPRLTPDVENVLISSLKRPADQAGWTQALMIHVRHASPGRPGDAPEWIEQPASGETNGMKNGRVIGGILVLLLLLGLAAAWQWSPLHGWLELGTLIDRGRFLRESPLAVFFVLVVYVAGGVVVFPVTLLVVATAVIFTPVMAFAYSLLGCVMSAAVVFGMGHMMGRETVRRLVGKRLHELSLRMGRRGLLTVITLRLFPMAPYSVVNFVAGASHIKLHDFVMGTVIGLTPGLLAITLFGDNLVEAIRNPELENFLALAGLVVFFVLANIAVKKWIERRSSASAPQPSLENVE
jgi:uncharacterized membrane protein YdjX (TVP38/TMEM64 family)